ncbi:hypothetical protein [Mucilaginibacter sp. SG564]|uniref:hypothetical protein n=1 Tax=unclassified Mucilaginibacter TaxID=2617802 RepID=UPI00155407DE|nr:hypothetical protein [Mucilaginibacter sp. SG564]NOW98938.1 hypothetical protein [Mucilaginibacter sp. SG564]
MFELFFALFLAYSCPAQHHNTHPNNITIVAQDDTGGENGHVPPGITPPNP